MNDAHQQGMTLGILLFNVIAYFSGSFLAKAVNYFSKREVLPRRLIGAIGVFCVTGFILVITLQALSIHQEKLRNLPPYERGVFEGEAFGLAIFPGMVVLIAAGISSWRKRRKAERTPNKLSEPTP